MKIKQVLNSVNTKHIRRLLRNLYHRKGPGRKPRARTGDPCLIEIDADGGGLGVRPISVEEAVRLGWQERRRRK